MKSIHAYNAHDTGLTCGVHTAPLIGSVGVRESGPWVTNMAAQKNSYCDLELQKTCVKHCNLKTFTFLKSVFMIGYRNEFVRKSMQSSAPEGTETADTRDLMPEGNQDRRSDSERRNEDRRRSAQGLFEMRARKCRAVRDRRQTKRRAKGRFFLSLGGRSNG